jgi:hypothetical protein
MFFESSGDSSSDLKLYTGKRGRLSTVILQVIGDPGNLTNCGAKLGILVPVMGLDVEDGRRGPFRHGDNRAMLEKFLGNISEDFFFVAYLVVISTGKPWVHYDVYAWTEGVGLRSRAGVLHGV